jgi:hypothetical protein
MFDDTAKRLKLGRIRRDEQLNELEKALWGPLGKPSSLLEEFDLDGLWRLLSPTGCLKWTEAWNGDQKKQNDFLQQLDDLKELVQRSFTKEKAAQ